MKKKYTKTISITFMLFYCLLSFSQISTQNNRQQISIDNPICEIPAVEESVDWKISRSDWVSSRMDNGISSPCATFIVNYNGFPTDIFGNPGPEQEAFQFAVDIWSNLIVSPVPIRINANWAPASSLNLGSASPAYYEQVPGTPTNPNAQILYPAALFEKLTGEDSNGPTGTSIDITCNFNSNRNDWYFGLDANPPTDNPSTPAVNEGEFDFVTVVLHELGHGLGVAGFSAELENDPSTDSDNQLAIRRDESGFSISGSSNFVSVWDTYVDGEQFDFANPLNPDTPTILDESLYPDPTTSSNNDLRFQIEGGEISISAPTAVAQNSGIQPKTYAPGDYNPGSSYSHLDEDTFNGTTHALMTPFSARGEANHDPGNIVLGFMEDMGWSLCQGSLSTNNFALESIRVSPNPFTNSITIELPPQIANQEFNISIVDINGRIINNIDSEIRSGEITISNLSNLKNALYFLNIESTTSDLSITKKIIKR